MKLLKILSILSIMFASTFALAGNRGPSNTNEHAFNLQNNSGEDIYYYLINYDSCPAAAYYAIPNGETDTYTELSCQTQELHVGYCPGGTESNWPLGWSCNRQDSSTEVLCMPKHDLTTINKINITKVNGVFTCTVS